MIKLKDLLFMLSSGNFENMFTAHIFYLDHNFDLFYIDTIEVYLFDRNFIEHYIYDNQFGKDVLNAQVLNVQAINKNEFEIHIFYL